METIPNIDSSELNTPETVDMVYLSGQKPEPGAYMCKVCGYLVNILDGEEEMLPACPICDARVYKKLDTAPE